MYSVVCLIVLQATANLVAKKIGVARRYLNPLPLDTPTLVQGVNVTFLDANQYVARPARSYRASTSRSSTLIST